MIKKEINDIERIVSNKKNQTLLLENVALQFLELRILS